MKILLGMSGGLDSTFAASILKSEGHDISGVLLDMHGYTDTDGAVKAANEVGVPLKTVDCRERFERDVALYFAKEYSLGRTPNPCTVCNRLVKFEALLEQASLGGFDKIATGHYARVGFENGRYFIKKGADIKKDQSYMLWNLTQEQLSMLCLPLGEATKSDVRESARDAGISSAEKPESQDICFLPDGNYAEYVESKMGASLPGNFIDGDGKVLGKHKGIIHYTVGQRRGLGIALGQRMFVSSIDPKNNTVTLLPDGGDICKAAVLSSLNFQKLEPPSVGDSIQAEIKIRYAAPPIPCKVSFCENYAKVEFLAPVKSVTPGQSGVIYIDDGILAGGIFY